jgi:DnaK suppressor protein
METAEKLPKSRLLPRRIRPQCGAPGGTRTHNPRLRRPVLYPIELRALLSMLPGRKRGVIYPPAGPRVNVKCGPAKVWDPPDPWLQRVTISDIKPLFLTKLELGSTMATDLNKASPAYKPKGKEEYMNPRQLAHFRAILDEQKRELSQDIDRTVHTMQDEATIFADPNDRATQESDMSLELRNRDRERKLIKKIDETIAHIDSGDYGYCEKCGVEIGLKRLEARPTATLCIDCKTLDELRERQVAK